MERRQWTWSECKTMYFSNRVKPLKMNYETFKFPSTYVINNLSAKSTGVGGWETKRKQIHCKRPCTKATF